MDSCIVVSCLLLLGFTMEALRGLEFPMALRSTCRDEFTPALWMESKVRVAISEEFVHATNFEL